MAAPALIREVLRHLSKGWVKAIVFALPATVLFAPVASIGFYIGLQVIIEATVGPRTRRTELDIYAWFTFLSGLGGLLGLIGAWLRFLFQRRLKSHVALFNWVVSFLLFAGVAAALSFLALDGFGSLFQLTTRPLSTSAIALLLLAMAVYGLYLALITVRPSFSFKLKHTPL